MALHARLVRIALVSAVLGLGPAAHAGEALVAVAANFSEVMDKLKEEFERDHPHTLRLSMGSTGKLFAQIVNGAPFDILLAADAERPRLLDERGLAVPNSRFSYALGELAREIGRYLSGDPVLASHPSTAYYVRKFVRKHRGPVAAALMLLIAITGGLAALWWPVVAIMGF